LQHEAFARFGGVIPYYNVNDPLSYGNPSKIKDFQGHGSHVTSIAIGHSSQFRGIAPNASCVAVSIFNDSSSVSTSPENFFAAIDWIQTYKLSNPLDILSISLGMPILPDMVDPFLEVMENLTRSGVTVVASAGNSGDMGSSTVFSPGTSPYVITVGNMDSKSFSLYDTSGQGPTSQGVIKPDVVAPGIEEWGADKDDIDGYKKLTGTSQAVPIVAGVIALLLEYCQQEQIALSPQDIKWLLSVCALNVQGADQLQSMFQNNLQGWGLVQLLPMIEFLRLRKDSGILDWTALPLESELVIGDQDKKVVVLPIQVLNNQPLAVEIDYSGNKNKMQIGLFPLVSGDFGIPTLLFANSNASLLTIFGLDSNIKIVFQVSNLEPYCLVIKCSMDFEADHFSICVYQINNLPWYFGTTLVLFFIAILAIASLSRRITISERK
jgi:hypothetical protein